MFCLSKPGQVMRMLEIICLVCIFGVPGINCNFVYCYKCHWTDTARESGTEDNCRPENFKASKVTIDKCYTGCHTFTLFHQNTTTMFSRQCSDKTVHRDECKILDVVNFRQKLCYCAGNYCNSGHRSSSTAAFAFLTFTFTSVISRNLVL